ncbi:potassium channel family protein [Actinomycetospora straminea]|uniref:Potassium channel domain-containing protein n=1 Tax=Actinomycetospora straminea TaxID=663607 RepID=A0ABP9EIS5_9PSEU|nr:potassium channel family protein [Actinomycetospora straminea]MDD7933148.1 potassium channel family protein [Actinomycetospora straminea]
MSTAVAVLSSAVGVALIAIALFDVAATLFSHPRRHSPSRTVIRATWSACHHLPGARALTLAGPLSFLVVVASWAAFLGCGWALVYWPWMPEGFLHAAELGGAGTDLLDALYFSLVTLSTLGYGDVSPAHGLLRLAAPLESLLGLGLLTASVSWLLSIFPVLSRRRALAYEIRLLEEVETDSADPGPPSPLPASVYADLTSRLVACERDLVTFPITYYFHDDDARFALPAVMEHLLDVADRARRQTTSAEAHFHGGLLLRAIDDFAAGIACRSRLPAGATTRDVLAAYARDHAVGTAGATEQDLRRLPARPGGAQAGGAADRGDRRDDRAGPRPEARRGRG